MELKNTFYEKRDGIAIITMNRPGVLNALNEEIMLEMLFEVNDANKDDNVRAIIITGAGNKAFCAGLDLKDVKDASPIRMFKIVRLLQEITLSIEEGSKPTIAAINGYALGGGFEIALACDIRIASENAVLGQPEVNLGFFPGGGGTQRLPKLVSKAVAKELIFTGRMIDARTAENMGLVNKVVPLDNLMTTAEEIAKEIISKPPLALSLAKLLINSSLNLDIRTGLAYEAALITLISTTEDFKEGVTAFLEKRKPKFKGI
ncbi:MAG: enoyl-CoA hydratase-related protein [Candidatus Bathyarchaeia archaeon]